MNNQWQDLADKCQGCERCDLAATRHQVVVGRGNPSAQVLLIGEAPGQQEDESGKPFVGRAGQLLEKLLREAGLDSARDLYIANVIKCRPPNNRKPTRLLVSSTSTKPLAAASGLFATTACDT